MQLPVTACRGLRLLRPAFLGVSGFIYSLFDQQIVKSKNHLFFMVIVRRAFDGPLHLSRVRAFHPRPGLHAPPSRAASCKMGFRGRTSSKTLRLSPVASLTCPDSICH